MSQKPKILQKFDNIDTLLTDIVINVKSYGAKGDGVTDDTTAIISGITYLVSKGGGVLFFPIGKYICTQIIMPHQVIIQGSGEWSTVLRQKSGTNLDFIIFDQAMGAGIHDITLDGNAWGLWDGVPGGNTSGNVIVIKNSGIPGNDNSRNLKIEQVHIWSGADNGIKIIAPNVWIFQLRFLKIDCCRGYGIWNSATDNTFYAIDIASCYKGAVYDIGSNNHFVGGKWFGCGYESRESSTLYTSARRSTYSNIEMQDCYGHGITINNTYDMTLDSITVDSCGITDLDIDNHTPNESAYRIQSSKRINILGCIASNYRPSISLQKYGLIIDGGCSNITYDISFSEEQIEVIKQIDTTANIIDNKLKKSQSVYNNMGVPNIILRPMYKANNVETAPIYSTATKISGLLINGSKKLDFSSSNCSKIFESTGWTIEFEFELTQLLPPGNNSYATFLNIYDGTNSLGLSFTDTNLSILPINMYLSYNMNGVSGSIGLDVSKIPNLNTGIKYYVVIRKNHNYIYFYLNNMLMGYKNVVGSLNSTNITDFYFKEGSDLAYVIKNIKFSNIERSVYEFNNWSIDENTNIFMPLQNSLSIGHGLSWLFQTGSLLPTASESYRNVFFTVQGGLNIADGVYQCLKSNTDTYSWKTIITG